MLQLSTPIQFARGVGPVRAARFHEQGLETIEHLLLYKPFRYEDRSNFRSVREVRAGEEVVLRGQVAAAGGFRTRTRSLTIFQAVLRDASGKIHLTFFNQPYLKDLLKPGVALIVFGQVKHDSRSGAPVLVNPEFEIIDDPSEESIHTGRIVPIYRRLADLNTRWLRRLIYQVIAQLEPEIFEPLPASLRARHGLVDRREALTKLHFPDKGGQSLEQWNEGRTEYHRRLCFEEFFLFQLGVQLKKQKRLQVSKDRPLRLDQNVRDRIKQILPFHPTRAQKRALKEIVEDMRLEVPMNRLLQGDVGCGKTLVALQVAVVAIENGYQVAFMAPTEILAEQHYRNLTGYLRRAPYRLDLLTGSVKKSARKPLLQSLAGGATHLVVGTHALLEEAVRFRNLALAIIDEQHRFGVIQRSTLVRKARQPDILVMSATPIPRSLAMTVYGDLDLTVIDEMPPGRRAVQTAVKLERSRKVVYRFLEKQLAQGRQAYIVSPLIEDSEKLDLKAAETLVKSIRAQFPKRRVGLLHGRLKTDEKDQVMRQFIARELDILVTTTVIEVGVDVANATVMMIENSERFGLAQLHQLRGRIGRGSQASYCFLMVDRLGTKESYRRLQVMRESQDGFFIAEKDLEIRGPGELTGTRQSGLPQFLFGNIVRDVELLSISRREAERCVREPAPDERAVLRAAVAYLRKNWKHKFGLAMVG